MGSNMGCLNMIPISTVNLVNSVGKEKKKKKEEEESVQPENQSEQLPEVIETSKLLDKFFMFELVVFALCIHSLIHFGEIILKHRSDILK